MTGRRYAAALVMFASEKGVLERVYHEGILLGERLSATPKLRRVLANRMLEPDAKYKLAEAFAGGDISHEFAKFLKLVIAQKREESLLVILWTFQRLVREKLRLLDASVTTAVEIDDATRRKISNELAAKVDATVDLHTEVDPSIVGGYILRWDTYRLDASVRGKLEHLREALTEKM